MLSMMIIALRNGVDRVEAMILAREIPFRVLGEGFPIRVARPNLASIGSSRMSIHAR